VAAVIEQLWYTRPPASAGRVPGFQIIAASSGLADPRAKLTTMAMRLCRYDLPPRYAPAPAPVSYGWVDAGGTRFCFRRADAGADDLGRPGNLTAHIIAGPPSLLGAADLAARFGSAWWWDGKIPDGKDLPPLESLAEIPAGAPAEPAHLADWLAAFVDALLGRRPRTLLSLRGSPADIAALVLAAERAVPGLMDAHSVSTYESPRSAPWFDIVGAVEPVPGATPVAAQPEARTPPVITAARTIVLSPDRARVTRTAARAAGLGTPEPVVTSLSGLVAAYDELDTGRVPTTEFLAKALATPTIAELTLSEFPEARQHVARELIRERGKVFAALAALAQDGFDAGMLAAVAETAGRQLVAARMAAWRWEAVLRRLALLGPPVEAACCRLLIDQTRTVPGLLKEAGAAVSLTLLGQASADGLDEAHPAVRDLLGGLGRDWRSVADDYSLPVRWRAIAVAGAVSGAASVGSPELARRLRGDPRIAGPLAELVGDQPLRAAVLAEPAEQQAALMLDIAPGLPRDTGGEMLTWFARRLPEPDSRIAFMAAAVRLGLSARLGPRWTELARIAIAAQLTQQMESGVVPSPTPEQQDLLRCAEAPDLRAWLQVLAVADRPDAHLTPLKSAIAGTARLPPAEASAALRCAVTFFAARRPTSEQFRKALAALDCPPEAGIPLLVTACLLVLQATGDLGPALELGFGLIDLVAADEAASQGRCGIVLSAEVRRLSRALPGYCRERLEFHAFKRGKGPLSWWKQETGVRARVGNSVGQAVASVKGRFGGEPAPN
jgi:hypothetical protein